MKVRNTVFASKTEERVFRALESSWLPEFRILPSLPLSAVFDLEENDVTERERQYFFKTSVDYTLCDKNHKPLLSVEFDGIGGGISRAGAYIPGRLRKDPLRRTKLEFKLRLAEKLEYPFFVISYKEAELVDKNDTLMILHSIIGQVLARNEFGKRLREYSDFFSSKIGDTDGGETSRLYQWAMEDTMSSCEVEAELKMDPIARKAAEYSRACSELGIISYSLHPLSDPALPGFKGIEDIEGLQARIDAMEHTVREGCKVIINMRNRKIEKTVWVRSFESYGVSAYSIARNLAEYLGFKKAYRHLKQESEGKPPSI